MKHLIWAITAITLLSCAAGPKVVETDPRAVQSAKFGSNDIHSVATTMIESLTNFAPLQSYFKDGNRPIVFVSRIQNKTMDHIDLVSVTDTIRRGLLHSGKFKFVDMTVVDQVREQLEYQNFDETVDPKSAKQFGKQIGADFMLYGSLSSIVNQTGRTKTVYYKFTVNLIHIETGILEWSDEKEISRQEVRRVFGQ